MTVPGASRDDLDFSARAVVADGVVAEVLAQLIQQDAAACHRGAFAEVGQGDIGAPGVDLLALHALAGHIQQIDRFHCRRSTRLAHIVEVGELQNIVDQLYHPAGLYMDLAGKTRRILGFCNAGLDELCITGDAGQRRFQLVADIGRELLPHFLVIFPQHPVGVDALGKWDKLLVGDILLDVVEVIGHLEHRQDEALGQQSGNDGGCAHHQETAQHDGRQSGVINRPDSLRVLRHPEDVSVRQQHGVIISLIAQRLGVAAVAAHTALHGLLYLGAAQMVLHRLVGGRLKKHTAVRGDESDAQRAVHISFQLAGGVYLRTAGSHKVGFPLKGCPGLLPERLVEHKDAECSGTHQPRKSHQKQQITYFFFHAAWFHCSSSSSLSVSL